MIYITGDTHGSFIRISNFCDRVKTTKEDKFIDAIPITVFCIHGNHEQRPYTIGTYEERKWHDKKSALYQS